MTLQSSYTLVVPTRDRSVLLSSLFDHLKSNNANFQIVVLDSGTEASVAENRKAIERSRLDVKHVILDHNISLVDKLDLGIDGVCTTYMSLCADDDLVFVDAIAKCVLELDGDQSFVGCHGVYLNFGFASEKIVLSVEYSSSSVDADDPLARIYQLLTRYEALTYAVFRTDIFKKAIKRGKIIEPLLFFELFTGIAPLVSGKVKRLDVIYYARRSGIPQSAKRWHPVYWIAHDDPDEMMREFIRYRARLISLLVDSGIDATPQMVRELTQIHILYFCSELRDVASIVDIIEPLILKGKPVSYPSELLSIRRHRTFKPFLSRAMDWLKSGGGKIRRMIEGPDLVTFTVDAGEMTRFVTAKWVKRLVPWDIARDIAKYSRSALRDVH